MIGGGGGVRVKETVNTWKPLLALRVCDCYVQAEITIC